MGLVQQANSAFVNGNYHDAVELYEKAGQLLGRQFFEVNIDICKQRIQASSEIKSLSQQVQKNQLLCRHITLSNSPV